MTEQEKLANELERIMAAWLEAGWWDGGALAHVLAVKVAYRLDTITTALRNQEEKRDGY